MTPDSYSLSPLAVLRTTRGCAVGENNRMDGDPLLLQAAPIDKLRQMEIEEARALQRAMVPTEPIRAGAIVFACKFRPAIEVGGDFLDYFWLDDRKLGFYLGDVVGKGLPAAMYAALAVGTLRGIKKTGEPSCDVLSLLNRRLAMRVPPARYCAVQYGVYDPAARELRCSNAGLPHPILIRRGQCTDLGEGGFPSGLFPDASYEQLSIPMEPGDAVLFTTDGIMEAQNRWGDEFGPERLQEVCATGRDDTAEVLLDSIFAAVDEFALGAPQHDDMTAAVLKLT